MPEEKPSDDLERFLSEQKSMEGRKQALIDDLLRQREAATRAFDVKLAQLGYQPNSGKVKTSHHRKKAGPPAAALTKVAEKPNA